MSVVGHRQPEETHAVDDRPLDRPDVRDAADDRDPRRRIVRIHERERVDAVSVIRVQDVVVIHGRIRGIHEAKAVRLPVARREDRVEVRRRHSFEFHPADLKVDGGRYRPERRRHVRGGVDSRLLDPLPSRRPDIGDPVRSDAPHIRCVRRRERDDVDRPSADDREVLRRNAVRSIGRPVGGRIALRRVEMGDPVQGGGQERIRRRTVGDVRIVRGTSGRDESDQA